MGVKCMTWAFETPTNGNEKVILLVLANRARDEDGTCFPGQEDVARWAYVSTKTVSRVEAKLEEAGYLRRTQRFREDGSRTSDLIHLCVPWAPTDTLSAGKTGRDQQTAVSGQEPKEETKGSEVARVPGPPSPKPVTYRGTRVPKARVDEAEHLLRVFNEVFGRNLGGRDQQGRASVHLKQIIGALLSREGIAPALWERAIRNTKTNPPGWLDDREAQIGDVFGDRAADHALGNNGVPKPAAGQKGAKKQADDLDYLARVARGEA